MGIDEVIAQMAARARELRRTRDARLAFHATYLRTTEAVAAALRAGMFADADWVDRWDVAFARLYLDALDASQRGEPVPAPWAVAFGTAERRPGLAPVRHVLLGMNAHINYDLPQALLAVISDEEFADPAVRAAREADHRRIDEVLAVRVAAEDAELQRVAPARTWQDAALQPLNRMATRRFLREARAKVWANAVQLSLARRAGPDSYARRLSQLEELCGRRVADLVRPGPVLLRLAMGGFGVRLTASSARPAPASQPARAPSGTGRAVGQVMRRRWKAGNPRSFDPLRVGRLETALWVAYYRREWARFLVLSVRVVRSTFGMDWIRTVHGAWLVLRANQLWAPSHGDPEGARRCMSRFYGLLRLTYGEPANPAQAARLEVEWWAVHREHQRGADGDSGPLVTALARLYAYAYGTDEQAVRPAAEHRATAMDISDRWVAEGCAPESPLLPAERAELIRSYAALLTAVHR
jgi:Family of unknown function (DUF5995)